jgi:hypothetical protein
MIGPPRDLIRLPDWWRSDIPAALYRLPFRPRRMARYLALDWLNEALREYLAEFINERNRRDQAHEALLRWASTARIENLIEWLDSRDWQQLNTEARNAIGEAVRKSYTRARREAAFIMLKRLRSTSKKVNDRLDDLERGTRINDRLCALGPPTAGGRPPGFEALRWMLGGQLWAHLAAGLSSCEGERWLRALAESWAADEIRKQEEYWSRWMPAMLTGPTVSNIVEGHTLGLILPDRAESLPFPMTDTRAFERIIEQAHNDKCAVLRTPDAWRVFHEEITRAHDQRIQGMSNPHKLVYHGGYRELASQADAKADNARRVVALQAFGRWKLPDGASGNLLILTEGRPPAPGRPFVVTLELGEFLCYGYVNTLGRLAGRAAQQKHLIPLIPPPKCIGRKETHGAQSAFQHLVLIHLRTHASELAAGKGVQLDEQTLAKDADFARLPQRMIPELISWWAGDGDRLARVSAGRYTLSDTWSSQRNAMIAGSNLSKRRSAGGRARKRDTGR